MFLEQLQVNSYIFKKVHGSGMIMRSKCVGLAWMSDLDAWVHLGSEPERLSLA
jgi:hypothetical protein